MYSPRRLAGGHPGARRLAVLVASGAFMFLSCFAYREGQASENDAIKEQAQSAEAEQAAILARARAGDIILRKGKGLASELIVSAFAGSGGWSHCALIVSGELFAGIEDARLAPIIGFGESLASLRLARLVVIHSVDAELSGTSGVQIQSLEDFCRYSVLGTNALYRPKNGADEQGILVEAARDAALAGIPFDRAWDATTPDSQYCSEFLWRLFNTEGLHGHKDWEFVGGIIAFTNFTDPALFDAIME